MTEQEYIHATNLAKVHIAYNALRDTLISAEDKTFTEIEHINIMRGLDKWRSNLLNLLQKKID